MTIEYAVLRKSELRSVHTFKAVEQVANHFLEFLSRTDVGEQIKTVHKLGASSIEVQKVVLPGVQALGFTPEKTGLFQTSSVPALRPDYYVKIRDTGILLEVERGKTTTNNMDLLDFWKCHICEHAEYLFLLVPNARPSESGRVMRHFKQVQNRLGTFFTPKNYVNVEAVFLFGY
ncbi:MAG: hypothetical protein B7Y06_13265 [Burkholderiales bacterium 24-55-52]|nr:MAG: hypothetical protein B7Y06_13265 [Burkholderiales bacterium 24-55-52]